MHLGESQDYFTDELALGHWQLEKRFKNIPILVTNATVPAGTARLNLALNLVTKAELLW